MTAAATKDVLINGHTFRAVVVATGDNGDPILALANALIDSAGNVISPPGSASATGTQSSVAATASAGGATVLAANTGRLGASIFNDSTATLYLLNSSQTPTTSLFTVAIPPNGYYEVPANYNGIVKGIWSAASGNARVTEYT